MARNPQEFLKFVAANYHWIVPLCRHSHRFTTDDEIESFLRSWLRPGEQVRQRIGQMKELGLLTQATGSWAPPAFLTRFLDELDNRHALASPAVIRAWVESLTTLVDDMEKLTAGGGAVAAGFDAEEVMHRLQEVGEVFRAIVGTVGDNCARIAQEVGEYRATEDARHMQHRLRRLIRLHEEYLAPVIQIIDIGGPFYAVTERVTNCCARLHILEATLPPAVRIAAQDLRREATWMRSDALRQAAEANRELAPLCEAARRESKIARGVNRALEALARHDLVALAIAHELPMTFDYDGTLLTDGSLETALVNALTYQPKEPPVLSDVGPTEFDAPWTVQDVLAALSAAGSVDDLLTWIITTCQAAQPERAIRLLHAVLLENPGQVHCDGARRIFVFGELVVQTAVWKWSQTHEPASR